MGRGGPGLWNIWINFLFQVIPIVGARPWQRRFPIEPVRKDSFLGIIWPLEFGRDL